MFRLRGAWRNTDESLFDSNGAGRTRRVARNHRRCTGTGAECDAQLRQQQQVVRTYCDRHPNDYDCRGYYDNSWGRNDYTRFYQRNRSNLDPLPRAYSA